MKLTNHFFDTFTVKSTLLLLHFVAREISTNIFSVAVHFTQIPEIERNFIIHEIAIKVLEIKFHFEPNALGILYHRLENPSHPSKNFRTSLSLANRNSTTLFPCFCFIFSFGVAAPLQQYNDL